MLVAWPMVTLLFCVRTVRLLFICYVSVWFVFKYGVTDKPGPVRSRSWAFRVVNKCIPMGFFLLSFGGERRWRARSFAPRYKHKSTGLGARVTLYPFPVWANSGSLRTDHWPNTNDFESIALKPRPNTRVSLCVLCAAAFFSILLSSACCFYVSLLLPPNGPANGKWQTGNGNAFRSNR